MSHIASFPVAEKEDFAQNEYMKIYPKICLLGGTWYVWQDDPIGAVLLTDWLTQIINQKEKTCFNTGLELIVQYPTRAGYRCRGFSRRFSSPQGVFIVFRRSAASGDQAAAEHVGEAFCAELLRWAGILEEPRMPCNGTRFSVECHALGEPACRKLLVALMDHRSANSAPGWPAPSAAGH